MTTMPRNTGNFLLQTSADGTEDRRESDEGLEITLFQRHDGELLKALEIACSVTSTGLLQLHLNVYLRSTPFVRSCTIITRR